MHGCVRGLAKGVIQSSIISVKQSAPNDLYTLQYDSLRACVVVVQLPYTVSGTRDDSHTTTYISRYCLAERQDARPYYYKLFIATATAVVVSVTTIGTEDSCTRFVLLLSLLSVRLFTRRLTRKRFYRKKLIRADRTRTYTVPSTISMAIDTDRDDGDENSH